MMRRLFFIFVGILMSLSYCVSAQAQFVRLVEASVPTFVNALQSGVRLAYTQRAIENPIIVQNAVWYSNAGIYQSEFSQKFTDLDGWIKFWVDNQGYVQKMMIVVDDDEYNDDATNLIANMMGLSLVILGISQDEVYDFVVNLKENEINGSGSTSAYISSINRYIDVYGASEERLYVTITAHR